MSLSAKKCCVPGCMDSGGMTMPLHYFPNPVKDKQRFNNWVFSIRGDIIGMDDDDIYKRRRVCHAHFEKKFCCRYDKLSNIALPTLHLPGPLSLPKFTFAERRPLRQKQNLNSEPSPSTSRTQADVDTHSLFSPTTISIDAALKENIDPQVFSADVMEVPIKTVKSDFGVTSLVTQSVPGTLLADCRQSPQTNALMKVAVEVCQPKSEVNKRNTLNTKCSKSKSAGLPVRRRLRKIAITPSEKNLREKLVQVSNKLRKCRNNIIKQKRTLQAAKNIISNPEFIKTMNNFTSSAKILTMMQLRECKKNEKGRRFSLEEKIIGLSIMKQSPKGYRFLRKIYVLPSPQTLVKLISMANIEPGINDKIFTQLKKKTEKMKTQERLCVLLFDEMSLKANVTYNEKQDAVVGFVTDGIINKGDFADHAQVFMIRGLIKNYKQPISYMFAKSATKGPELAKQLKIIIKELHNAGLIVVATVCDQGTNNRQAIKLLVEETRGNLLRIGNEPKEQVFFVDDIEVVPLYDPPHLLKCIRNNLMVKNLKTDDNKVAKWTHIELLHKENPGYKGIRLIPKLTDYHVVPAKIAKMKVKYATQVFSRTVASNMGYLAEKGLLPVESKDTADILLFFDKLFDSLNGSFAKKKFHGKPLLGPVTETSPHHKFWCEARRKLKNMKFINVSSGKEEKVPTLNNWVWTLNGVDILLKNINKKYNCKSIWMRHLNQDPIENFFGAIRSHGCRNINPTPEKFKSAFVTLLINNLSSIHAAGANCENDNCSALGAVIVSVDCKASKPTCDLNTLPNIIITPLEEKKDDPRKIGPLQYVSGYFARLLKKKIFRGCLVCNNNLINNIEPEYLQYREYEGRGWLCSPSDSLLQCVSYLQDINYCVIKENLEKNNIKSLITTMVFMHVDFDFIKCNEHKENIINKLVLTSCRFFIYNYCKEINKILTGKRDNDDHDDHIKCKAKKYFHKCYKRKH